MPWKNLKTCAFYIPTSTYCETETNMLKHRKLLVTVHEIHPRWSHCPTYWLAREETDTAWAVVTGGKATIGSTDALQARSPDRIVEFLLLLQG